MFLRKLKKGTPRRMTDIEIEYKLKPEKNQEAKVLKSKLRDLEKERKKVERQHALEERLFFMDSVFDKNKNLRFKPKNKPVSSSQTLKRHASEESPLNSTAASDKILLDRSASGTLPLALFGECGLRYWGSHDSLSRGNKHAVEEFQLVDDTESESGECHSTVRTPQIQSNTQASQHSSSSFRTRSSTSPGDLARLNSIRKTVVARSKSAKQDLSQHLHTACSLPDLQAKPRPSSCKSEIVDLGTTYYWDDTAGDQRHSTVPASQCSASAPTSPMLHRRRVVQSASTSRDDSHAGVTPVRKTHRRNNSHNMMDEIMRDKLEQNLLKDDTISDTDSVSGASNVSYSTKDVKLMQHLTDTLPFELKEKVQENAEKWAKDLGLLHMRKVMLDESRKKTRKDIKHDIRWLNLDGSIRNSSM